MSDAHVDLEGAYERVGLHERLGEIPRDAVIRGVFFDMIESALRRHGLSATLTWKRERVRYQLFKMYPLSDYLRAFVAAAALIDEDPIQGMADIYSDGSRFAAETWFGKAFREYLRPDPAPALKWIARSHHHFVNFGSWRYEARGKGHAVLHIFDEYVWIEGAHRGGCEGLLIACGVHGTVDVELDSPYSGRLDIRWDQDSRSFA